MMRVFISHAQQDTELRESLCKHLAGLCRLGTIQISHPGLIGAGEFQASALDREFESANIIVLLVSADFMASESCSRFACRAATRVDLCAAIPVVVRPCHWQDLPVAHLKVLPEEGKPVVSWQYQDEAWTQVASAIGTLVERIPRPVTQRSFEPVQFRRELIAGSPPNIGGRPDLRNTPRYSNSRRRLPLLDAFANHDRNTHRVLAILNRICEDERERITHLQHRASDPAEHGEPVCDIEELLVALSNLRFDDDRVARELARRISYDHYVPASYHIAAKLVEPARQILASRPGRDDILDFKLNMKVGKVLWAQGHNEDARQMILGEAARVLRTIETSAPRVDGDVLRSHRLELYDAACGIDAACLDDFISFGTSSGDPHLAVQALRCSACRLTHDGQLHDARNKLEEARYWLERLENANPAPVNPSEIHRRTEQRGYFHLIEGVLYCRLGDYSRAKDSVTVANNCLRRFQDGRKDLIGQAVAHYVLWRAAGHEGDAVGKVQQALAVQQLLQQHPAQSYCVLDWREMDHAL